MRFFKENLILKLVSVVLALLLWLIVFNVSNPEQKESRTVELQILNQDTFSAENKTWEVDRSTVTVSYTVRSNLASSVKASDFKAYIDLSDYSITGSVPVYVELVNQENASSISDIVARPSVVHVSIEDLQKKKFDLQMHQQGNVAEGYTVSSITVDPTTIYVNGPESSVGRISSLGLVVNVDGLNQNTDGTGKIVFYDANGKIIQNLPNVSLSQEQVDYTVVIHKKKDLILSATTEGNVQNGYTVEELQISPKSISVSGSESVLDGINQLTLPALDVSNAKEDVSVSLRLKDYLPSGLSLAEPNSTVYIHATIKKLPESTKEEVEQNTKASTTEESTEGTTESSKSSESTKNTEEENSAETKGSGNGDSKGSGADSGESTENKGPSAERKAKSQ